MINRFCAIGLQKTVMDRFSKERDAGKTPVPPSIPDEIIEKMTHRYVFAYEKITGEKMGQAPPSYE